MEITPSHGQLTDLLYNGEFIIPAYQRPYAWKAEHVNALLSDLHRCVSNSNPSHFFGVIKLHPIKKNQWDIIDGQQRIVTFSLICAYLCRTFGENRADPARESHAMRVMFNVNERHSCTMADNAWNLDPRISMSTNDNGNYLTLVRGGTVKKNGALTEAWKTINDFFALPENQSLESRQKIFDCLLNKLIVVCIEFKNADPLTIFETENDRNKRLEPIQLACVHFYSCVRGNKKMEGEIHRATDKIRTLMNGDEEQFFAYARCFAQCRYGRLSSDRFAHDIRDAMEKLSRQKRAKETIYLVAGMSEKHAIQAFDMLSKGPRKNEETLSQLAQDAGKSNNRRKIEDYLDDLRRYTVSQSVLFSLLRKYMEESQKEKKRTAKFVHQSSEFLWAFIQRAAHSFSGKFSPSQYEQGVAELARRITLGEVAATGDFLATLKKWDKKQDIIPDSSYIERMKTLQFRDSLTTAKYILARINEDVGGESVKRGTAEHILPKAVEHRKGWDFDKDEHTVYAHRLGNLTLLVSGANKSSEYDNSSFAVKKAVYQNSAYKITRQLCKYPKWDKRIIESRQARLARRAASIWRFKAG